MPLIVTAHEDKFIRLFDITTGAIQSKQGVFSTNLVTWSQVSVHTRCSPTWTASPRCRSTPPVSRSSRVRTTVRYVSGTCLVRGRVRRRLRRTVKKREKACWTLNSTPRCRSWRALVRTALSNFMRLRSFSLHDMRMPFYDFFFSIFSGLGMLASAHARRMSRLCYSNVNCAPVFFVLVVRIRIKGREF